MPRRFWTWVGKSTRAASCWAILFSCRSWTGWGRCCRCPRKLGSRSEGQWWEECRVWQCGGICPTRFPCWLSWCWDVWGSDLSGTDTTRYWHRCWGAILWFPPKSSCWTILSRWLQLWDIKLWEISANTPLPPHAEIIISSGLLP